MKKVVLTPLYGQNPNAENAAIAFSERQWGKVLKLRKSFPECWDPEYAAGVQIGNVNYSTLQKMELPASPRAMPSPQA